MQLHQKLKGRDGRTEQNRLWRRTPHLSLVPVLIPREKKLPQRGSLLEKTQHNFLLYFPITGFTFLWFTVSFSLFFPLLFPTAWWSPLSAKPPPLDRSSQFHNKSFLPTCGYRFGAHFPPQRCLLTAVKAISYLHNRKQAKLFKPEINAISNQVCSAWIIFSPQKNMPK